MEQVFNLEDLKGKTIEKVLEDDQVIILFDDATFTVFYSSDSSDSVYQSDEKIDLFPNRYNYTRLFDLGIISQPEKDEIYRSIVDARHGQQEYELKQLAQLKAKYPNA